jgi:hypothetical protein
MRKVVRLVMAQVFREPPRCIPYIPPRRVPYAILEVEAQYRSRLPPVVDVTHKRIQEFAL